MSRAAPRSHLAILAVLVATLIPAALLSFWRDQRRDERQEDALEQDIAVLRSLPNLRGGVRRVDLLTELCRSGRGGQWPAKRVSAAAALNGRAAELRPYCAETTLSSGCADVERALAAFLEGEDRLVSARGGSSADAARGKRDELLDALSSLGDAASDELEWRLARARGDSLKSELVRLLVELASSVLGVLLLYVFVLRPIALIDEAGGRWHLGEDWSASVSPAIAELRSLASRFSDMARRLNAQFEREKELNEFKTSLVSAVSHEFGNALSIINNAVFLLAERLSAEQRVEAEPLFEIVRSNVEVLSGEVLNVLSHGRVEAGRLDAAVEAADVKGLLRTSARRMRPLCLRKKLRLTLELPENVPALRADPAILSLAISNLLSNAIKYTPEKGSVAAGLRSEPGRPGVYRFFVRDTGIGLSEEDKTRILRGHYRTEQGRRMTPKGFGIGLSLTRRIVEAHGSRLDVDSRLGVGSEFSFALTEWGGGRVDARKAARPGASS